MTSSRQKFETRTFYLGGQQQVDRLAALIPNLPIDPVNPLEVVIREKVKIRKLDQNALMWVGPLKDIANQAWSGGRQYDAKVWHEYFKEHFLPEEFNPELTKEGYVKWDFRPDGQRILVGSTTELTTKGFSLYLHEVEAFGAELGVEFHANPNDVRMVA